MYIILGCGTAGYLTAKELSELKRDIVIVEKDPERIKTLKDVCAKSEKSLLEIRDFGRASLRELKKRMLYYELSFKEE